MGTLTQPTTATLSIFWCPEPKSISWTGEGRRKGKHWNLGDELSEVIKLPGRLYRTVTNASANYHLSELLRLPFGPEWRLRKFEIPPAWYYSSEKKKIPHENHFGCKSPQQASSQTKSRIVSKWPWFIHVKVELIGRTKPFHAGCIMSWSDLTGVGGLVAASVGVDE